MTGGGIMTTPNSDVVLEPAELEAAGATIADFGESVSGLNWGSHGTPAPTGPLAGFEVATAVEGSAVAVGQAVSTISGRCEQFAGALRAGAHALVASDEIAAGLLTSLGDLNRQPEA